MPDANENRTAIAAATHSPQPEIVIGKLVGFDDVGLPLVDWPGNTAGAPLPALTTASITGSDRGRTAALLFAHGDPTQPVILGLIRQRLDEVLAMTLEAASEGQPEADVDGREDQTVEAQVDDDRVVISGRKEIVLQCGNASITLTRAGKVLIRGEYLLSRSTGVNRIKGGSVQLN